MDELKDVYNHFLLYYGRDIPKMQNAAKATQKKMKRIPEEGEEEGLYMMGATVLKSIKNWFLNGQSWPHYHNLETFRLHSHLSVSILLEFLSFLQAF